MIIHDKISALLPLELPLSIRSFVSNGDKNRIDIRYFFDPKNKHFYAKVIFGDLAQGPPDHAHGGAIASIIDEVMGGCAWSNKLYAMTANLDITYLKAIKLNEEVFVEAWIESIDNKKMKVNAIIQKQNGDMLVKAKGLFIRQSVEKFKAMGFIPDELFQE
ncbi:MAG: PaaI family thioesterase [Calditrichaeota bacterium]|nr:MAG: PaaI family thioesterase [Calditrichota bacterium]MBL1208019.1 PaaI family thioesterase [Calditrichota bacterium]NOG47855.1 PaaI family thioesterase [Calditrichota bacterium]